MTGKKYYKVVDRVCGHYISVMVGGSDIGIKYSVGEFAYPTLKGSKLFVFDDLQIAIDFGKVVGCVFECEVINPFEYNGGIAKWYRPEEIRLFWENQLQFSSSRNAIKNTVLCDAVKLVREIEIPESNEVIY